MDPRERRSRNRIDAIQKRIRDLERKLEQAAAQSTSVSSKDLLDQAREINGIRVLATRVDPADPKVYRSLADQIRDRLRSGIVAIGGGNDGKALLLVAATPALVARGINAGALIRDVAKEIA